uniref:Uncharacterized protein n=1 Tax=Anguilla anguilla TaxID=7936 RepID=A0A0E9Q6E0_ANGAN
MHVKKNCKLFFSYLTLCFYQFLFLIRIYI